MKSTNGRRLRAMLLIAGAVTLVAVIGLAVGRSLRSRPVHPVPPVADRSSSTLGNQASSPSRTTPKKSLPSRPRRPGPRERRDGDSEHENEPGTDSPDGAREFRLLQQRDENGVVAQDGIMRAKRQVDLMRFSEGVARIFSLDPPPSAGMSHGLDVAWPG